MQSIDFKNTSPARFFASALCATLWVLLAVIAAHPASAQTFSASISGTVTDATGAVVPGARIEAENMDTRDTRIQKTDGRGSYSITGLLPGPWEIRASAPGFETFLQTGLILRANTAATVNISLHVGATHEQVVVSGERILLDTESATNSVTMDTKLVQSLPNNTLDPLNFVYDLAGTTEPPASMYQDSNSYDQYGSTFAINGGRSAESEILIDGAPSTAVDWGGLMVSPISASVQEQQVVQNEYDAQYERGGEGVINIVTKGGSPRFHAQIYDYLNNSSLDANNWSNDQAGYPIGKLHRDQFGVNAGGPLWRRHNLYIFGAYEGLRQPQVDSSGLETVPTQAERGGNFANDYNTQGTPDIIYNPFSTTQVTVSSDTGPVTYYTRTPFLNNQIPTGMINAVGQKIVDLYGLPNRSTQGNGYDLNNYYKQGSADTSNDKFDWRVDWNPSPKNHMFVRMDARVRENSVPSCFFCDGADNSANNNDNGYQVVFNDTWTPNAKWLINGYGAYTRWREEQTSIGAGVDASAIGLSPGLFQAPLLPVVSAGNYQGLGNGSYDKYVRYLSTGIINVTHEMNQHTLKFGFNYDVAMINNIQDSAGSFNFDSGLTSCDPATDANGNLIPGAPCQAELNSDTSGNPIASMLLGTGSGGSSNIDMDPAMSLHTFGMYLEDVWHMTPRLTVTAGLRYDNQRPATERHNRLAYFDPTAINPLSAAYGSNLPGEFQYAGVDGRSRYAWEPDNLNFGPRLEMAYQITPKLVMESGAGIFYAPTSAMVSYDSPGEFPGYTSQTNWISTQDDTGYIPANLVSNPFPNGLNQPTGNSLDGMTLVGDGAGQIWVKGPHPVGTLYQWSFGFKYQTSANSELEIGYTGVRGRHLLFGNPGMDLTQMNPKYLSLGPTLLNNVTNPFASVITNPNLYLAQPEVAYNQLLRPFPEYTYLQQTRSEPGADSQFDALNVKYTHSFSHGIDSITTYQWSKSLDDGSEAFLGWASGNNGSPDSWRNADNPKLDYSISSHDVPQSFAEAGLFQIPYGAGRHWGATAPQYLRQTLGGWNLAGDYRLTSGYPFTTTFSYNPISYYGFPGSGLPDVVGNPKPAHRSDTNWLNMNAFAGSTNENSNGPEVTCTVNNNACQPFPFRWGNEPRYMNDMRDAPTNQLDTSLSKTFIVKRVHADLRGDFINILNHPNYSYIGDCIDCGGFGDVYGQRNDSRTTQISLTLSY